MQDLHSVFHESEAHMKEAVHFLQGELKQLRTGRASASIVEGVMVDYYGTATPFNQVANINVADATLLTAQPYDPSQISAIEKAIHAAGLGLNPSNDGKVIRIPIPPLTEERRKDLVKRAHEFAEKCRNSVRQARREANDRIKKLEKDKEISQDDERRGHDEVQRLHDHYISQVASILEHKEADILAL